MRIVQLTPRIERRILANRRRHDLAATRVAERIVNDVSKRGDLAVLFWTRKLDGVDLRNEGVWMEAPEMRGARRSVSREFLSSLRHAARNIAKVAKRQMPRPWRLEVEPGVTVSQHILPIDRIGCYVPGGRFSLVSSLLMTVVPAKVAGVREIVVACPNPNAEILAAADFLGITHLVRIGGAQAIAALAYGTPSIPRVDKIFGPGNRFVTAAKQIVSADCAIDMPAGPTEAVVFSNRGNPAFLAADLIAQAEHAPDAVSLFVTTSRDMACKFALNIQEQLARLPKTNPAHRALCNGAICIARNLQAALDFISRFAPEHLTLADATTVPREIRCAGTVFLGQWAAQPLGDYVTGSNHVLPTSAWARGRGGLSAADFVKCVSLQSVRRDGFKRIARSAMTLAHAEQLVAHARAIEVRQQR